MHQWKVVILVCHMIAKNYFQKHHIRIDRIGITKCQTECIKCNLYNEILLEMNFPLVQSYLLESAIQQQSRKHVYTHASHLISFNEIGTNTSIIKQKNWIISVSENVEKARLEFEKDFFPLWWILVQIQALYFSLDPINSLKKSENIYSDLVAHPNISLFKNGSSDVKSSLALCYC